MHVFKSVDVSGKGEDATNGQAFPPNVGMDGEVLARGRNLPAGIGRAGRRAACEACLGRARAAAPSATADGPRSTLPHCSEPEANLVREAAVLFQPHIWINVHSGMEALFMPFDHKVGAPGGGGAAASNATLAMLAGVNKEVFGGRCVVGPGGKSVGYLAHGTATDYMHGILKVPVSLTWEVFGDESAGGGVILGLLCVCVLKLPRVDRFRSRGGRVGD